MNFSMLHPADQIVMIMNRLYYYGMTTTTGGNLSIKDSDGVVWISPSGIDKGNLRREDIMQILPDGTIVGIHRPSVEYPFHLAIYKNVPTSAPCFTLIRRHSLRSALQEKSPILQSSPTHASSAET